MSIGSIAGKKHRHDARARLVDPAVLWTGWGRYGPVTTAPVWTLASTPAARGSTAVTVLRWDSPLTFGAGA